MKTLMLLLGLLLAVGCDNAAIERELAETKQALIEERAARLEAERAKAATERAMAFLEQQVQLTEKERRRTAQIVRRRFEAADFAALADRNIRSAQKCLLAFRPRSEHWAAIQAHLTKLKSTRQRVMDVQMSVHWVATTTMPPKELRRSANILEDAVAQYGGKTSGKYAIQALIEDTRALAAFLEGVQ